MSLVISRESVDAFSVEEALGGAKELFYRKTTKNFRSSFLKLI
jgi:hypothetical protein